MASIKFRNIDKMKVILVHTALEWTLIALLLLNGLLSYFIAKFAAFFGLKPPCIFCSRVDHVIDHHHPSGEPYRDLLCDAHAAEVSRLGYCSRHQKLAEAGGLCEDCSPSDPDRTVAVLSRMKQSKAGEMGLRCSCCDSSLEIELLYSRDVLKITQKGNSVEEAIKDYPEEDPVISHDIGDDKGAEDSFMDPITPRSENELGEGRVLPLELIDDITLTKNLVVDDDREMDGTSIGQDVVESVVTPSASITERGSPRVLETVDIVEEHPSVPAFPVIADVEVEPSAVANDYEDLQVSEDGNKTMDGEANCEISIGSEICDQEQTDQPHFHETGYVPVNLELQCFKNQSEAVNKDQVSEIQPREAVERAEHRVSLSMDDDREMYDTSIGQDVVESVVTSSASITEIMDRGSPQVLETVDIVGEHPSVPAFPVIADVEVEPSAVADDSEDLQVSEDGNKAMDGEANCEISIGSEICDQEQTDQPHFHETGSVSVNLELQCFKNQSETVNKDQVSEIQPREVVERAEHRVSSSMELNEVEEERIPETPTSIEGIHAVHRRFFLERRESGAESWDESIANEIEGSEVLTVDHLKSALRAEQKALRALYAELEEERSASSIATNQTMAMITRIQEEKAAMQMEALQYQRMMEEQSEYDQEALQLLNELMTKREKEKHEVEKELEVYRKKVLLYEARERRKSERSKGYEIYASSSADDSDDLSLESHEGVERRNIGDEDNQIDSLLCSGALPETANQLITIDDDESLDGFEEERVSILHQLTALKERLLTLDHEEPADNIEENDHDLNADYEASSNNEDNPVDSFADDIDSNGKHSFERRNMGFRGKSLLPLFDAIAMHDEGGPDDASPESALKLMIDRKKLAIMEEVDNVYERLQALEADREFTKHCIVSLKKGDKGMDLLQEILQHLRDLRSVELRVRNAGGTITSWSS